jgi:hypothetical protein
MQLRLGAKVKFRAGNINNENNKLRTNCNYWSIS